MPDQRQSRIAVNATLQGSETFRAYGWKVADTGPGEPIRIRHIDGTVVELVLTEVTASDSDA